jgi:hypothetical protein
MNGQSWSLSVAVQNKDLAGKGILFVEYISTKCMMSVVGQRNKIFLMYDDTLESILNRYIIWYSVEIVEF